MRQENAWPAIVTMARRPLCPSASHALMPASHAPHALMPAPHARHALMPAPHAPHDPQPLMTLNLS